VRCAPRFGALIAVFLTCSCLVLPGDRTGLELTPGSSFCEIDANGCATDGGGAYGNDERCTIQVTADGTLTATQFNVEPDSTCRSDFVTIDGTKYCGGTGPSNVAVAAGSTFTWHSDGDIIRAGWTICLTPSGMNPYCDPTDRNPSPDAAFFLRRRWPTLHREHPATPRPCGFAL